MDFITVAQNLGIAVACLMALGLALWRSLIWLGRNVVQPVAVRHMKFLDELAAAMASQAQALQTMAVQQGRNIEGVDRILGHIEEMIEKQDLMFRTISELHSRITHMDVTADSVTVQPVRKREGEPHDPPRLGGG